MGDANGISFLVIVWRTAAGPNLLVLWLERERGAIKTTSFEAARTDPDVLILRAGQDAARLRTHRVAVLGVGAIGSHVAELLARSGVGTLALFDHQRLRPGDIVRHAASSLSIGAHKVDALELDLLPAAPWTRIISQAKPHWEPTLLGDIAGRADLVIDAVGVASFTAQLSRVCAECDRPLLAGALYRHGDVGRIRYQVASSTALIADRGEDDRFPVIPAGAEEAETAGRLATAHRSPWHRPFPWLLSRQLLRA